MNSYTTDAARKATEKLGGRWYGSYGMAKCPAHNDSKPSLSIQPGHTAVLYKCHAGCSQTDIINALAREGVRRENYSRASQPPAHHKAPSNRLRLALSIWDESRSVKGTPAGAYLDRRGIFGNGNVRFHPNSKTKEEMDGELKMLTFPALVIPLHSDKGFVGIQRVFLTPDGEKADLPNPKKGLGDLGGGATRLGLKPKDRLNLAEGFEDAQSVIQKFGLPHCWSVAGKERYGKVDIPASVEHITIYSQHGEDARDAIERAHPHLTEGGRTLDIELPPPGGDWNDALMAELA